MNNSKVGASHSMIKHFLMSKIHKFLKSIINQKVEHMPIPWQPILCKISLAAKKKVCIETL